MQKLKFVIDIIVCAQKFCGTGAEMFVVRVQANDDFPILLNFRRCMWVVGVLKFSRHLSNVWILCFRICCEHIV